ncbi:uncharacterized protein LOC124255929 [Haliotis rubra]|uniref:uncharacterized protein LOC124255929 n=1 Tax=Haliotis rubra TaxID=36100 RepID=UPI001EE62A30|nr:uncharacterized protein LOC124255929 [Haliotis rubra]
MDCAVNTIGRYVRIVQYCFGDNPLTLCEVEVRGAPLHNTCGDSSVVFSRHTAMARQPHYIIASYENIGKFECASRCLRKASCNALNFGLPSMGVVRCEMLAVAHDPVSDASWNVYTIKRVQCPSD